MYRPDVVHSSQVMEVFSPSEKEGGDVGVAAHNEEVAGLRGWDVLPGHIENGGRGACRPFLDVARHVQNSERRLVSWKTAYGGNILRNVAALRIEASPDIFSFVTAARSELPLVSRWQSLLRERTEVSCIALGHARDGKGIPDRDHGVGAKRGLT